MCPGYWRRWCPGERVTAAAVQLHVICVFPQAAQCGKLFTSHQTSTQRPRRLVSTRAFASAARTTWPTTILRCSSILRGTRQRARRLPLTPSRPFTPSWLRWRRPARGTSSRWSLWTASCLCGTQYGSPGCSPAAPHSRSSASAHRTSSVSSGDNSETITLLSDLLTVSTWISRIHYLFINNSN